MYVFLVCYHVPLKNKKTQYACNAHITKRKYPKKTPVLFVQQALLDLFITCATCWPWEKF